MDSLSLDIPKECGVMLLTGTSLFPHSSMDLHIIEPRYRAMLADSLEGSWMFVIANLISHEEEPYENCVAPVGTIAVINPSRTLPDGRSVLVITGIGPVSFDRWIPDSPYPKAKVSPVTRERVDVNKADSIKSLILDYTEAQLGHVPLEVKESVLESLGGMSSITALIDNVSHNFIGDSDLRHELMIELDDSVRASKLINAISP